MAASLNEEEQMQEKALELLNDVGIKHLNSPTASHHDWNNDRIWSLNDKANNSRFWNFRMKEKFIFKSSTNGYIKLDQSIKSKATATSYK